VVQNRGAHVASPQQVHNFAINYMTHPIHSAGAVCFHPGGVGRQCSAYDDASTSFGAARPPQSTPLSWRCRAEMELGSTRTPVLAIPENLLVPQQVRG
jgi:hypothetical protein